MKNLYLVLMIIHLKLMCPVFSQQNNLLSLYMLPPSINQPEYFSNYIRFPQNRESVEKHNIHATTQQLSNPSQQLNLHSIDDWKPINYPVQNQNYAHAGKINENAHAQQITNYKKNDLEVGHNIPGIIVHGSRLENTNTQQIVGNVQEKNLGGRLDTKRIHNYRFQNNDSPIHNKNDIHVDNAHQRILYGTRLKNTNTELLKNEQIRAPMIEDKNGVQQGIVYGIRLENTNTDNFNNEQIRIPLIENKNDVQVENVQERIVYRGLLEDTNTRNLKNDRVRQIQSNDLFSRSKPDNNIIYQNYQLQLPNVRDTNVFNNENLFSNENPHHKQLNKSEVIDSRVTDVVKNDPKVYKAIELRLSSVVKEFEGNLSRILDEAFTNATVNVNKINSKHGRQDREIPKNHKENEVGELVQGSTYPFPRPLQFNPTISGPPSPALIGRPVPPKHQEAGYTSPPNLNLNSDSGTLHYHGRDEQGPQETAEEGGAEHEPTVHRTNPKINDRKSNAKRANAKNNSTSERYRVKKQNDNAAPAYVFKYPELNLLDHDHNRSNQHKNPTESLRAVVLRNGNNDTPSKFDKNTSIADLNERLSILSRGDEKSEIVDFEDEDKKAEETIVRDNRVSERTYPLYTSIDLKGLNTYRPGHNSLEHSPPDPYVALFLSHYGRYVPSGSILTSEYRNLYSYLASNNIHNNKPFGSYKIYEDADG